MADGDATDADRVIIPEQLLRGSRREMLASIDGAITGLLALRHLIAGTSGVDRAVASDHAVSGVWAHRRTPFAVVGQVLSRVFH